MLRRCIPFVLLLVSPALFASELIEQADQLYEEDRHREGYEFLTDAVDQAEDDEERAELYWRLARVTMEVGDLEEREGVSGDDLLARYEEGESYADRAIELDPDLPEAYYWKSANVGRWGEVKGIVNSLFKAKPMRDLLEQALTLNPDYAACYYVLSIMYRKVPGGLVSFGNDNYAVSLSRKSIDANMAEIEAGVEDEVKLSHYMELARNLASRDWKESKRRREHDDKAAQYRRESNVLEKALHYEGVVDIPEMSDREEAIEVMQWVISEFESRPSLSDSELQDLEEARADLESWTN